MVLKRSTPPRPPEQFDGPITGEIWPAGWLDGYRAALQAMSFEQLELKDQ